MVAQAVKNHDKLPVARLYRLRGRDPFAGQPVTSVPMIQANSVGHDDPFATIELVLEPNDAIQQLRMVTFERSAARLYAGFYRTSRCPKFEVSDHALLLAVRPTLRAWDRLARVIGRAPLSDAAMASTLDALTAPALLVERARIVFANEAASRPRMIGSSLSTFVQATSDWIAACKPDGYADTARIAPCGLELLLVLPHALNAPALSIDRLPPSLRRVAAQLADGLSDKEIAEALMMPLATTRTYVARVFRALGVTSRRELMRVAGPHSTTPS